MVTKSELLAEVMLTMCAKANEVRLGPVALVPEEVLVALLAHGDEDDGEEGPDPAHGADRRVGQGQRQQEGQQEVRVGHAPELLQQVHRHEGEEGVLRDHPSLTSALLPGPYAYVDRTDKLRECDTDILRKSFMAGPLEVCV